MRKTPPKVLAPVRPSEAIAVAYQKKLTSLLEEMHKSLLYWVGAAYGQRPPELASDESPARFINAAMSRLERRWLKNFDDAAPKLARWFAKSAGDRSDKALQLILKQAGFSVEFKMTAEANDVIQATVAQNVQLIKSIAQQHLSDVQGLVMRSVAAGRDVGGLAKELEERYGITKRRAQLIARTENNKATATLQRVRQQSVGIKQAMWVHSSAGKEPRQSHVKAGRDKVIYEVDKGWFDPDEKEWIRPGELIGCRCFSTPILPTALSQKDE